MLRIFFKILCLFALGFQLFGCSHGSIREEANLKTTDVVDLYQKKFLCGSGSLGDCTGWLNSLEDSQKLSARETICKLEFYHCEHEQITWRYGKPPSVLPIFQKLAESFHDQFECQNRYDLGVGRPVGLQSIGKRLDVVVSFNERGVFQSIRPGQNETGSKELERCVIAAIKKSDFTSIKLTGKMKVIYPIWIR